MEARCVVGVAEGRGGYWLPGRQIVATGSFITDPHRQYFRRYFFKKGLRYQSGRVGLINNKPYINYFNGLGASLKNGLRAGGPAAIFLCDGFVNPGKNASDWHTDCL